ncbi:DUF262 domain-containing protein [Brevundimonas pondensis]|uniref:DUF262 domain-containing protein n=1 Tax=Brevundimonas pondensis TaxID=2774189 RepID=UPI003209F873
MSEIDLSQDDDAFDAMAPATPPSDKAIEKEFSSGRLRVVQDRNDFFLPHVVDFIEGRKWGNLRPEYQRRLRWDNAKKSRLIESFIMNVPVPPIFLYEKAIGAFEVMDGQQRLNAVLQYLKGEFALNGLKIWPSLNGRRFNELPPLVRKGLERSKISAITLMSDNAISEEDSIDLRAQVFDRLNTGGESLNPQELRNSLYSGSFNKLVVRSARNKMFTDAWDIPPHEENTLSDGSPSKDLRDNNLFKRMLDCEIVLRYFSFRDRDHVIGSVKSMLDGAMKRHRHAGETEIASLETAFTSTLKNVVDIFGNQAFRLPHPNGGQGTLSRPLYDAQMVATEMLAERAADLVARREAVIAAVHALARPDSESYDLIVGRANTAATIRERIDAVYIAMFSAIEPE